MLTRPKPNVDRSRSKLDDGQGLMQTSLTPSPQFKIWPGHEKMMDPPNNFRFGLDMKRLWTPQFQIWPGHEDDGPPISDLART